jgi:[ribosomal protein S5]-alanine N-acetyltransferase
MKQRLLPKLVGRRVFLRPPRASDCAEFTTLNRVSGPFHRGLVTPPRTPERFTAFLKRSRRMDTRCFFICRKTDGAILGSITASQIFYGALRSAYVGYYIGAPHAGQGYLSEALPLLLRYAFRHLKLHRVEANIQPGNAASIALVKRGGFTREGFSRRYLKVSGRWRDHERWALLSEDWQRAHPARPTRNRTSAEFSPRHFTDARNEGKRDGAGSSNGEAE